MKIAFVSDNGTTISRHFGRARQYVVVTIADGQEISREARIKSDCHGHHHGPDHDHTAAHGHDDQHHQDMLDVVADCEVVIVGGMGAGMDQRLRAAGVKTIRTPIGPIEMALGLFLNGRLKDNIDLVH